MRLALHLIAWTVLATYTGADLSLFSTEEFVEQNGNIDESLNRLYLFSNTKECNELTDVEKQHMCKDYCSSVDSEKSKSTELVTQLPGLVENGAIKDDISVNLAGALAYYKSFVHKFLSFIKHQDYGEDIYEYKIGVELNRFQIVKLEKFAKSANNSNTMIDLLDITDILKDMFVHVDVNKKPSFFQKILIHIQNELIDTQILQFALVVSAGILTCYIMYIYFKRNQVKITLTKMMVLLFIGLFILSVINTHKYLAQKKQIYRQQKLKEMIPEECLLSNQDTAREISLYSNLVSFIRSQVGYTATSKQCLEYQEALFIASGHNNYVETIVYTISEGLRPIAEFFGKLINEFYSSLTQNLSIFQYIPLMAMVTVIFLPLGVILVCFICLVLFGYEFNFLHLFSFKKTQIKVQPSGINRQDLVPLLNMIQQETNKLQINTLGANECLPSVDNENLSESLTRSLRVIFDRINEKQSAANEEINNLRNENKFLFIKDNQQDSEMEKSGIEEARCLSLEYAESDDAPDKKQKPFVTKQVSIGISKSANLKTRDGKKNLSNSSESNQDSDLTQENLMSQGNNGDSEDEDFFVMLAEN